MPRFGATRLYCDRHAEEAILASKALSRQKHPESSDARRERHVRTYQPKKRGPYQRAGRKKTIVFLL
jgi:hypothetical protein